ncbi:MAG: hypothetical protein IPG32_10685 [Saprospirales bacterium]|nr:hypothetical protein [Saprospirales bacterium]
MNKLIVPILLLSLSAPFAGAYVWLQWEIRATKKEVKKQIQTGLAEKELVFLKLPKPVSETELRWEHAREFEYQGRMYDIVEAEILGDTFYCHCLLDHRETELKRQLSKLMGGAMDPDPQKKEQQTRLFEFQKTLYLGEDKTGDFPIALFEPRGLPQYCILYSSIPGHPATPPPEAS